MCDGGTSGAGRVRDGMMQLRLVADDITVDIGLMAALPSPAKIFATEKAAAAVGPYNQGFVVDDGTVYVIGCIGLLPGDGVMVEGIVEGQKRQSLGNIRAFLNSTWAGPNDIGRTDILLDGMADFAKVNAVYKDCFGARDVPASSFLRQRSFQRELPSRSKLLLKIAVCATLCGNTVCCHPVKE